MSKDKEIEKKNTVAEMSVDARLIYQRLRETDVGDVITYREIASLVHRPWDERTRGYLETARRKAQSDDNIIFDCVRTHGIRRVDGADVNNIMESHSQRGRHAFRRALKAARCISDFAALPPAEKARHNLIGSAAALILHETDPRRMRLLQTDATDPEPRYLPTAESLERLAKG